MDEAIALLREIRDAAWQSNRCHARYSEIEQKAEEALKHLGVVDGPPYPNPRPANWWVK